MFEHCKEWIVVINLEEQYSVWPSHKEIPIGWRKEGKVGTKEACLSHINDVWTDMRPKSLRETMARTQSKSLA